MRKYLLAFMFLFLLIASCEDILEEVDISNSQVTIFAPLNNTTLNSNEVNFNWDRLEDATSYRFQLATPNFVETQQLVLDSIFELDTLGNVSSQIQQTLLNGTYEWRIKAMNSGFETAYTNSGFTVSSDDDLDIIPPNTPELVAPTNGSSQDDNQVNFRWTRDDVSGTAERDSIYFFSAEALRDKARERYELCQPDF
ncbi:MAG: hypothetical protein AAGH46_11170, partial [Bacteroidota bacterium]